jgi:hypothetical protein
VQTIFSWSDAGFLLSWGLMPAIAGDPGSIQVATAGLDEKS